MKTTLKNGLYLLGLSMLVSLMASCLGGSSYDEDIYSLTDAELLSFSLSSDSVSGLASVVFTIDQQKGEIYNYDSMAYLAEIKDKVIVKYISGTGTNNVLNITNNDSVWVKSGDSIDISIPQILKVFALDGETKKLYRVQLNIHQIDPDSVQYRRIASDLSFLQNEETKTVVFNKRFLTYTKFKLPATTGYSDFIKLYSSTDAVNWAEEGVSELPANTVVKGIYSSGDRLFAYTETGELYVRIDDTMDQWIQVNKPSSIKVKSILGFLNVNPKQPQPEGLSMVVEADGIYKFALMKDFDQWEYSANSIPDNFPLYVFSSHSHQVMLTERISIFGGVSLSGEAQNSVWSTENGLYWANLSTGSTNVFPPLKGANVFYYNQEFWLINGKSGNNYNEEVYYSIDGGVTWLTKPAKCWMPGDYSLRYNASLVVDKDNKYFYIIGGEHDAVLPEVWKGFLNKMEFEH